MPPAPNTRRGRSLDTVQAEPLGRIAAHVNLRADRRTSRGALHGAPSPAVNLAAPVPTATPLASVPDDLIAEHGACAVLMVDRVVIQAFDDHASAVQAGKERFGSGNFSAHTLPVPVVYSGVLTAGAAPSERG